MKKTILALITVISLTMYSCMCGCGIEDPDKPRNEMSEIGQILMGTHYLGLIPGTDNYFQTEGGLMTMFIPLDGKWVLGSFDIGRIIFEEASDIPFVKFSWSGGNMGSNSLSDILTWSVQEVTIGIPSNIKKDTDGNWAKPPASKPTDEEEKEKDYVQSLIEGTNTFEE
ncbi:MAG: hypothetical protein K9N40_12845 [Candidatus Cloacimonetes bacterium]|nr:hypothetical protein [Candidatus Cloacimonadota bacterium]